MNAVCARARQGDEENKRVVGVLLGEQRKGRLDVTSSFAVPFEEDDGENGIWFLDHSYLENMYRMSKKISAKEKIVGWYSTGPKLRESDIDIHELFYAYAPEPVLVIVDVRAENANIPTSAFAAQIEVKEDGTEKQQKTFVHVPNSIEAFDAEEIGVEHLLRDVKDNTVSTLSTKVSEKLQSMRGLKARLEEIKSYMDKVVDGSLPMNHEIMGHLQNAFNLLPNLNLEEYVRGFNVSSNDAMLVIYLSSLIRSVIALHDLIKNKAENKERERAMDECAVKGAEGKENEKPEDGAEKTSDADAEKKK
jgi:26S proteasome regulatory subunit N8|tara:strand:- start:2870 stop:3787 length:918 start_codon:yes stop_codon:yes gene_type:complete